jgi:hypothetical protein
MADDSAKKAKAKAKKGKDKQGKDGKQGAQSALSVAGNPRAAAQVRRAKGWGGLAGFVLAAWLSMRASVPIVQVGERALIAGLAGYLVAWGCSVTVWRHLLVAELRHAAEEARQRRAEADAAEPVIKPRA